jgi:sulfatase maturation enzyme AslB (radical SAM superfamily)
MYIIHSKYLFVKLKILYKYLMLKYCSQPWNYVNIWSSGEVRLCLCPSWTKNGPIGILNSETSLETIFSSARSTRFRNSIVDQSFKNCASHCSNLWNLESKSNLDQLPIPKLPTNLHLHLDLNCNLKCASCRNTNIYSPTVNPKTKEILDILIEEYQDHKETVFIYGDGIGDMFTSAAYQQFLRNDRLPKCFKFCITTNGNLLTKNLDILKKLHDQNQIDLIIVSFDAATNDTYKNVRGGNFELLTEGIEQVVNLGIKVSAQYVTQYKNYLEILDYVALCKRLGVSHIGLQKITRWPHMNDDWWIANKLDDHPNVDYEFLISALKTIDSDPQCGIDGGLKNLLYPLQIKQN